MELLPRQLIAQVEVAVMVDVEFVQILKVSTYQLLQNSVAVVVVDLITIVRQ
jgi:hypothetical protein